MTITSKTYFKSVRGVPAKQWPPLLREAHDLIIAHTDNGKDWSALKWDKGFKALCDATFEKWEAYFEKNTPSSLEGVSPEESKLPFKKYATEMRYIYQFDNMFRRQIFKRLLGKYIDELQSDIKSGKIKSNTEISKTVNKVQVFCVKFYNSMESESAKFYIEKEGIEYDVKKAIDKYEAGYFEIGANKNEDQLKSLLPLEGITKPEKEVSYKEVKHVNQFLSINQTVVLKHTMDTFITELQKDIRSKEIGKHSVAAATISAMQEYAVRFYNGMKLSKYFELPAPLYKKLIRVVEDYDNQNQEDTPMVNAKIKAIPLQGVKEKKDTEKVTASVEITPKELKYVRQYLSFNKSVLLKSELEKFIDALQKDIKDQHISKHSKAASAIIAMQDHAVNEYNKMRLSFVFEIPQPLLSKLNKVLDASITDTYTDRTRKVPLSGLSTPTDTTPTADSNTLTATVTPPTEKNETPAPAKVMNSVDFLNLSFKRLGFQPPWLNFIGDPSPGFTMMVYGRPKFGKSYLCLDFAGYLARHHGRVLYVAKEEKLDRTLQDKIVDKSVAHPNLVVADAIPEALSSYEFIFLDSINKLGLSPQDLERLKTQNKGKSFVYIFQVNKAGAFKGSNTFQHDVDVVVELPEIGKAVQYGRFNQGGELNVFPEHKAEIQAEVNAAEPSLYGTLEGIKKKTPTTEPAYPEWVTNKELSEQDRSTLKEIYNYYKKGDKVTAINLAMMGDTFLRELIPDLVWMRMGGKITRWSLPKHHLASVGIIYPDWVENSRDMDTRSALREFYDLYNDQQFELVQNVLEKNGKAFQKLIPKEFLAKKEEPPKEQENTKRSVPTQTTDYADEFRALKQLHEENIGRKITDKAFNELMEQAIAKTPGFLKQAKELQEDYMNYIRYMDRLSSE